MEKNKTKCAHLRKISTEKNTVRDFLRQDQKRLANQRRRDRRHLAKMPLWECISESFFGPDEIVIKSVEEKILQTITKECLYSALKQLKPKDREVLFLRFFCGWKLSQIAAWYEISESAVSQRISKNLKNLRKYFLKNT